MNRVFGFIFFSALASAGTFSMDSCQYGGGSFTQNSSCSGTETPTLSNGMNGLNLVGSIGSLSAYDPHQVGPRTLPAFLFWSGAATGDFTGSIQISWSFQGLEDNPFTWELDLDLPYSGSQNLIKVASGSGTGSQTISGSVIIPVNESLPADWAIDLVGNSNYNPPFGSLTLNNAVIHVNTVDLNPVPEPSTLLLIAIGCGVLWFSKKNAALLMATAMLIPGAKASSIFLLSPPTGYSNGNGEAINASGQVAVTLYKGSFESQSFTTALFSNGGFIDVAAGNGSGRGNSVAAGINDSGAQVGTYFPGLQSTTAILISPSGTLTNLKNLNTSGTSHGSEALNINNAGTIVGESYTAGNAADHPVSWNSTGTTVTDLGTLSGGAYGAAFGINASGEIVGTAGATNDNLIDGKAFVYSAGHISALAGVSGASDAYAVNNAGQIAGDETIGGNLHAFLDTNNTVHDLGTLGGATSAAYAINSLGQVVGYSDTLTGSDAFLYTGGSLVDLNTLLPANSGWVLEVANGINDSGQITGYGMFNGQEQAFLFNLNGTTTTTPEPSSLVLLGAGVVFLAWRKFRSRRRLKRVLMF